MRPKDAPADRSVTALDCNNLRSEATLAITRNLASLRIEHQLSQLLK